MTTPPLDSGTRSNDGGTLAVVLVTLAPIVIVRAAVVSPPLLWVGFLVALIALHPRWVWIALIVALLVVRSTSAFDALSPVATGSLSEVEVKLLEDPRPSDFGRRARVVLESEPGRPVVLATFGPAALGSLVRAQSGDRLVVDGTVRGEVPSSAWEISRRIVGRLAVTEVVATTPSSGIGGLANHFREALRDGAAHMGPERQALFMGLVVGDDRGQSAVTADNFRAAGLGHLLAVSGQNMVFVLIVARPLVSRVRSPALRTLLALAVLAFFGFVTRFEPSVTRAITMIGLSLVAGAIGRPGSARRTIPVAVVGLLLIDPLFAWSLALLLSVLATLGLIVLAPMLEQRVAGPEGVTQILCATVGAQVAVAPALIAVFGRVPITSLFANVAAVPASGLVMMWGLLVGPLAGLAPEWAARLLHAPTAALLWWIEGVAATTARVPAASLGATGALLVAATGAVAVIGPQALRKLATVGLVVVLVVPFAVPRDLSDGRHVLTAGVEVLRSDKVDVVVVDSDARAADALEAIREARLGRIDLLIVTDGSRSVGGVVRVLAERFSPTDIWAPHGHQVPGARAVTPLQGQVGDLEVVIHGADRRLG